MGIKEDLRNQVAEYLSGDYDVIKQTTIPSIKDVGLKKKAVEIKLCSFAIDIRNSSKLMDEHNKQTCAKIHKSFLLICTKIISYFGGSIRSFNGDGLIAFWYANDENINRAVQAGMTIKYLVAKEFSPLFEKYQKIDFGIGIDYGDAFIVRAGVGRDDDENDLVFISKCVNFSVALANQMKYPKYVGVSTDVFGKLDDNHRYLIRNGNKQLMWSDGNATWKEKQYPIKMTGIGWEI